MENKTRFFVSFVMKEKEIMEKKFEDLTRKNEKLQQKYEKLKVKVCFGLFNSKLRAKILNFVSGK